MKIQIPEKLQFLYHPARYKVGYGGRGGAKSWGFADASLIQGIKEKKLVLCAREFQNSIADSVHALLKNRIDHMNLGGFYEIQQNRIIGANGTEFIFAGLRHNINKIKSIEGVDICWVEEAQTVSKASWDVLIPTIRKEGSEIWVSFNPELETDETYKRFVLNPPSNAVVVKVNWSDNPWFPEVLKQEMDDLKVRDEDAYLHVWEGHCKQTVEGAVFAKEMRAAMQEGRICRVPPTPGKPVDTFWDLGKRDHTSIWFVQFGMGEYRIVDFYQNHGEYLPHYLRILQERGYVYGMHFLPHDGGHERLGALSIEKQIKAVYPQKVKVLERINKKHIGIDAARTIFPLCWFDEQKCADGLQALRRYRYDVDPVTGGYSKDPLHDENSDAADAFLQIAMGLNAHKPKPQVKTVEVSKRAMVGMGGSWMGA